MEDTFEWPEVDQFLCNNKDCIMYVFKLSEGEHVLFSRFDKTYRCAECGNEVEMTEPRKAEWVSVGLYNVTQAPDGIKYIRYDPTVRAFEGGDWPQVLLYCERLHREFFEEIRVFGERLPPKEIEEPFSE